MADSKCAANDCDNKDLLLHFMIVGFHHKKGCQVEYCYPPLNVSNKTDDQYDITKHHNDDLDHVPAAQFEAIKLPRLWQSLPSLALPDGSHNYDNDTVFFHLPDLDDLNKTVFAVSCYRQISTDTLLVRTPDMTRNTVQKSVVAIMRAPLYGIMEYKLKIITRAYFNERDFSKTQILNNSFNNLYQQLSYEMLDTPQIFTGLLLQNLFDKFGKQVIILFKLLLLERKTVFIMSPIRELTTTLLSICSLIPGLLQHGMCSSTFPFHINADGVSVVLSHNSSLNEDNGTEIDDDDTEFKDDVDDNTKIEIENRNKNKSETENQNDNAEIENENPTDSNCTSTKLNPNTSNRTEQIVDATISGDIIVEQDDKCTTSDDDLIGLDKFNADDHLSQNFEVISNRSLIHYGLPLQIFKCSSYCLPYFSISYFDILTSERVRSCFVGSSNHILKRWENDIEVFVTDDQIEIKDPTLKRILTPTVEDNRFMCYLMRAMTEFNGTLANSNSDLFDQALYLFEEGSDDWIRCHFKNYLLHMMRCSFFDETTKEYRSFNPLFMAAWKSTYNYKAWSTGPYTDACLRDIEPQHPFNSNRLNNLKFKISHFLNNQHVVLNQTINTASKLVISNAKSTVNNWFNNLSAIQPRKMITRKAQSQQEQKQQEKKQSPLKQTTVINRTETETDKTNWIEDDEEEEETSV